MYSCVMKLNQTVQYVLKISNAAKKQIRQGAYKLQRLLVLFQPFVCKQPAKMSAYGIF